MKYVESDILIVKKGRHHKRYSRPKPGEWFLLEGGERIMCCDCGLVHNLDFRVVDGQVKARAWVNKRSTGAVRRSHNITIKKVK